MQHGCKRQPGRLEGFAVFGVVVVVVVGVVRSYAFRCNRAHQKVRTGAEIRPRDLQFRVFVVRQQSNWRAQRLMRQTQGKRKASNSYVFECCALEFRAVVGCESPEMIGQLLRGRRAEEEEKTCCVSLSSKQKILRKCVGDEFEPRKRRTLVGEKERR